MEPVSIHIMYPANAVVEIWSAVASGFLASEMVQVSNLSLANQVFGMMYSVPERLRAECNAKA